MKAQPTELSKAPARDQLDRMIAWEEGELSPADTIALFQELLNTGLVWQLQGCYGRFCEALIERGYIHTTH